MKLAILITCLFLTSFGMANEEPVPILEKHVSIFPMNSGSTPFVVSREMTCRFLSDGTVKIEKYTTAGMIMIGGTPLHPPLKYTKTFSSKEEDIKEITANIQESIDGLMEAEKTWDQRLLFYMVRKSYMGLIPEGAYHRIISLREGDQINQQPAAKKLIRLMDRHCNWFLY